MKLNLFILSLIAPIIAFSKPVDPDKVKKWEERKHFTAKDSTEAAVEFNHSVLVNSRSTPSQTVQLNQIDKQLWHLFGPLSEADMYAVPKNDHQVSAVKATKKGSNIWEISYKYRGTMQVKNGPADRFKITLPLDPDGIYDASAVGSKYPCTDHHYNEEGDFWYFWNPEKPGCKLKEESDFRVFSPAKLTRIANVKKSYPEYHRMADSDGVIRISILMGLDEPKNNEKNRNPVTSTDINAKTYRNIRKHLVKEMDFSEPEAPWSEDEIRKIVGRARLSYLPYVETLTKDLEKAKIEMRLFFGPSGITEADNKAFHYFYADALENSAIVIYDGHSGLGGHLDIDSIESSLGRKIRFNPNKYQIYFINSCTSYTYYNLSYFERKAGTKNLDILVNGLATAFDVLQSTNLALLEGVEAWANKRKPLSYQDLATTIDSSNLFSVNGDEDNPKDLRAIE